MSSSDFDQGLLLRRTAYSDADWICDWLLREGGKQTLIAKRARGSKKRFPGGIEPFAVYTLKFRSSQRGMGQLYEATPEQRWENIPLDPFRLAAGSHVITTLNALSAERQGSELYDLLGKFSAWLDGASGEDRIEIGTFRAQLQLLNWAGMLPDLSAAQDTGTAIDTLRDAWMLPDVGFLEHPPEGTHDALKFNAEALTVLIAALQGRFPDAAGNNARRTVRTALNAVVRHELGRDLKTWRYYSGTFK